MVHPKLQQASKYIYIGCIVFLTFISLISLSPHLSSYSSWLTPPVCLFLGLSYGLLFVQHYPLFNRKASKLLLQYSVVGLGFGMNLEASLASGLTGMSFTIISVIGTMVLGWLIGEKLLEVNSKTSYLISSGTAICGGSAIASVGPTINADEEDMSVSLGIIFLLNAIALFVFPYFGRVLGLNEDQFGFWAAIAIHDTSSVVAAGSTYGEEALKVATTIKLTRALWIIPLAFISSWIFKRKEQKISIPWFILFFALAMVVNTYLLQDYPSIGSTLGAIGRKGLCLSMFFIGASLSVKNIKSIGLRPLILAVSLWVIISLCSLLYVV